MVNKILKISSSSNDRLTSEIEVSFDNAPKESCKDFIQMGNKSFCFMSFGVSVSSDVKCNQIDMQKSENLNNQFLAITTITTKILHSKFKEEQIFAIKSFQESSIIIKKYSKNGDEIIKYDCSDILKRMKYNI